MGNRMNYSRPQFRIQGRETVDVRKEREHESAVMKLLTSLSRQEKKRPRWKRSRATKRAKMATVAENGPSLKAGDDVVMDVLSSASRGPEGGERPPWE